MCRHVLSDKVGLDRQFAVLAAAVDQDGELDFSRPAEIHELVERGTDRASGVKNVVDENDVLTVDVVVELGAIDDRIRSDGRKIVAIKRDIEDAVKRPLAFELLDLIAMRSASGTPRRRMPTR